MAKIGLNSFRYGILTEASDGTPSYDGAKKPAKAISCSVSISSNDVKLYADDAIAESDTSFQSGSVSAGIDNEDEATMAELLGHEYTEEDGIIRNSNDVAPYVGFGRIVNKMVGGKRLYKVEFLYKVKFSEPNQDDTTKGENIEFGTTTIDGVINTLADGRWSRAKTFETHAEALDFLVGLLDSDTPTPPSETYTVTYDVNGGTGEVAPVDVVAGESITVDDGSGITAPEGKEFAGWAKTSTAQTATVTGEFTPTGDTTLYAVYTDL